jgi:hypothetical protein
MGGLQRGLIVHHIETHLFQFRAEPLYLQDVFVIYRADVCLRKPVIKPYPAYPQGRDFCSVFKYEPRCQTSQFIG